MSLCENGAVINTAITIACAKGVLKNYDSNLLECNGGHISLTKRASTKAKVSIADFDHFKA